MSDNPENEEYMAEGSYTCNECGTSYEAAVINEGDVCECGGSLNKE
jgi:DNA-directed RNA polymerase subunit RPC12/RpoP